MGLPAFDIHTSDHFIGGFLSVIAFSPAFQTKPLMLLIVVNIAHLLIELVEKTRCENRKNIVLESMPNHALDMVSFLVGSILGVMFVKNAGREGIVGKFTETFKLKHRVVGYMVLLPLQIKLLYEFYREVAREIWPNANTWYLKGAWTENCYH